MSRDLKVNLGSGSSDITTIDLRGGNDRLSSYSFNDFRQALDVD